MQITVNDTDFELRVQDTDQTVFVTGELHPNGVRLELQRVWEDSDTVRAVLDLELSPDEAGHVAALLQLFADKARATQQSIAA